MIHVHTKNQLQGNKDKTYTGCSTNWAIEAAQLTGFKSKLIPRLARHAKPNYRDRPGNKPPKTHKSQLRIWKLKESLLVRGSGEKAKSAAFNEVRTCDHELSRLRKYCTYSSSLPQMLKEQYLSYRRVFLQDTTDIFEERRIKAKQGMPGGRERYLRYSLFLPGTSNCIAPNFYEP